MAAYFPEGKIRDNWNNGELCFDSATWLQCPGMRLYYCGKFYRDYGTAGDETLNYFELDKDGEVTSRAGISFTRLIDPGNFTSEQTSVRRETKWHITKVRESWWEFAKEYDADIILRTALVAGSFLVPGGPVLTLLVVGGTYAATGTFLSSEAQDPAVFCEGGKKFGETMLKCEGAGCAICNFNMPQKITPGEEALNYYLGKGDPKYVAYYEAFPPGEEEAWQIDPFKVSLTTLIAWNVAVPVLKAAGKAAMWTKRLFSRVTTPWGWYRNIKWLIKAAKAVGRAAKWTGRQAQKLVQLLIGKNSKAIAEVIEAGAGVAALGGEDAAKAASLISGEALSALDDIGDLGLDKFLEALDDVPSFSRIAASQSIKHAVVFAGAYALAREESMEIKFLPIGSNVIGWKKPFNKVFMTGEGLPELIPDANKYYLQLTKDKYKGNILKRTFLDQNQQRFFLASPCLANLALVKSKCKCWDDIDGEAITTYDFGGGEIPIHVASIDDDATTEEERYRYAIKKCTDRSAGIGAWDWKKPTYKPECIIVNPILIDDTFCYSGSHPLATLGKIGVFIGVMTASIAAEWGSRALGAVTAPFTAGASVIIAEYVVGPGANIAVDYAGLWLTHKIEESTKWPNH
jgi:hypothetical protein